ncbi:MAG TPA: lipase [Clostridia bacterium]|nr:lipase [Clostridia bacterium]
MDKMDTQENIQLPAEDPAAAPVTPHAPQKKKRSKKITALLVVLCILVAAIIPYPLGLYDKALGLIIEDPLQYPYVLVHGLGGWGAGSGINEAAPYWGATTGSLAQYLATQGYAVHEASVGPFSSTWDRCCELYAQLTGTTVDYGEAHAKAHNHARFGRSYEKPLFEGWGSTTKAGQMRKINLVSHSFGGPTIRLLTSLLANGADEEKQAGGGALSPLFEGGHGDWVNSVTTLNSPNNGTTLVCVLDEYKLTTLLLDACLAFAGVAGNSTARGYLDFQLEQFGITSLEGEEKTLGEMKSILAKVFSTGTDNAAYDLSLDGAAQLNKLIEPVDSVTYISYSYCTTKENTLTGNHLPALDTLLVLMPTALLMGRYAENTVSDIEIDKSWLPNDGLVNVVSARYPLGEPWKDFDADNIESGKWNVMPTRNGDHGTAIGLNAGTEETHSFYTQLFTTIDKIPRDKKHYFKF